MAHFRAVHQCATCGKIYRTDYFPLIHGGDKFMMVCGRCGDRHFELVIAKPILFGLRGWEIGAGHIKFVNKITKPTAKVIKKHGGKNDKKTGDAPW